MRRRCLAPLSEEEEGTLEAMPRHYPTARVRLRAQAGLMSQRDFDQAQIAKALGRSWRFVHTTLMRYQAQGFLGLGEHHPGASRSLTPEQEAQVIRWGRKDPKRFTIRSVNGIRVVCDGGLHWYVTCGSPEKRSADCCTDTG